MKFEDLVQTYVQMNQLFQNTWHAFGALIIGFFAFIAIVRDKIPQDGNIKVYSSIALIILVAVSAYSNISALKYAHIQREKMVSIMEKESTSWSEEAREFVREIKKRLWTTREVVIAHIVFDLFTLVSLLFFLNNFKRPF